MGVMNTQVFALLDDRIAPPDRAASRLYTGFVREHRCEAPQDLDAVWARVDEDLRAGLPAVLLADYEWGAKLLGAGHHKLAAGDRSALRVLMFTELATLTRDAVDAWLQPPQGSPGAAGVMDLQPSVDRAEFTQAIADIHEAIRAGETYQVNYTYRLHGQAFGAPLDLYRRLRARQRVAYGAFIALPECGAGGEATHVLSCSPELFLRHDAGLLTARPMKGTARRVDTPEGDSETARHLSIDVKNRAENLMIVDLLRNDLGRVAEVGSVKVPDLFTIEPYATVFQMTSTVQARLKADVGVADLLRAVFPCGSITGAPKEHTMALIAGLETTPRGLYCGAIGWLDAPPGDARCGNFCLSVAIRTLTLGAQAQGLRPARLGVGAGIVLDSQAADEFEECRLKARFLTRIDPGFELFETMLAWPGEGVRYLDLHLARLAHSARTLSFAFDAGEAAQAVHAARPAHAGPSRVRLTLAHDGTVRVQVAPLPPLPRFAGGPEAPPPGHRAGLGVDESHRQSDGAIVGGALATVTGEPVSLLIAPARLPDFNPLSAHKTTLRAHYDEGVRRAEEAGAFDSLFFTADGRLVEGGRSSVFVQLDGRWFTPPVSDGALPGILRGLLLQDSVWHASERSLRLDDLRCATAVVVCNALRGPLRARLNAALPPSFADSLAPATVHR
jgi:para-aminobenzoate synthetase/4-amino-4-deoxychorismate lyase